MVHTACCGHILVILHSSFALHLNCLLPWSLEHACRAFMTFCAVEAYDADVDTCTLGSNSGSGAAAQSSRGIIWHNNSIHHWLVKQSWLLYTRLSFHQKCSCCLQGEISLAGVRGTLFWCRIACLACEICNRTISRASHMWKPVQTSRFV